MGEEGEGGEPDVVALSGRRSEFESTVGSQDEDGATKAGGWGGGLGHGGVVADVEDGLNGDWERINQ